MTMNILDTEKNDKCFGFKIIHFFLKTLFGIVTILKTVI